MPSTAGAAHDCTSAPSPYTAVATAQTCAPSGCDKVQCCTYLAGYVANAGSGCTTRKECGDMDGSSADYDCSSAPIGYSSTLLPSVQCDLNSGCRHQECCAPAPRTCADINAASLRPAVCGWRLMAWRDCLVGPTLPCRRARAASSRPG